MHSPKEMNSKLFGFVSPALLVIYSAVIEVELAEALGGYYYKHRVSDGFDCLS